MINAARGEVPLTIGGRTYRLCLTLGALAQLEEAFGAPDLDALGARLNAPSMRDLLLVLRALLAGGGEAVSDEELAQWPMDIKAIAAAIAETFGRSGLGA
ncbi:MAG TPA: gene transfer agent family protein [Alphaproteobacteria bacterium]|nr:gene transfer agent family protein [Alphaproteobacteria bacterium]HAJ48521.1 gene transfer agent family protein [Alphaproteobacteria bacterium]